MIRVKFVGFNKFSKNGFGKEAEIFFFFFRPGQIFSFPVGKRGFRTAKYVDFYRLHAR